MRKSQEIIREKLARLNGGGCSLSIKVLRENYGLSGKIQGIFLISADYKMSHPSYTHQGKNIHLNLGLNNGGKGIKILLRPDSRKIPSNIAINLCANTGNKYFDFWAWVWVGLEI